jgi:hypothetical protein
MKIKDFDLVTRRVVYLAHIVDQRPTPDNLARLRLALEDFDRVHEAERTENLLRALREADIEV